jgi:hypothetical protein
MLGETDRIPLFALGVECLLWWKSSDPIPRPRFQELLMNTTAETKSINHEENSNFFAKLFLAN